jgi:hypothetical protein
MPAGQVPALLQGLFRLLKDLYRRVMHDIYHVPGSMQLSPWDEINDSPTEFWRSYVFDESITKQSNESKRAAENSPADRRVVTHYFVEVLK